MAALEKAVVPGDEPLAPREITSINEKSLLRKLDLKLLPPLCILYLLSFLDRSNGMLRIPTGRVRDSY